VNDKRGGLFLVSSTTAARFEGFYTLAASERGRLKEERKHIVSVLSSSLSKNSRVPFSYKKRGFPSDDFSSSFSGKTSGNHPRERTSRPFSFQMYV
jgi:hypothetical protein